MPSLSRKLLSALLCAALLPLSGGMVALYTYTHRQLSESVQQRLQAIADAKAQALEDFALAKQKEVAALAQAAGLAEALTTATQGAALEPRYSALLQAYGEAFQAEVLLAAPGGELLYRTPDSGGAGSWHQPNGAAGLEYEAATHRSVFYTAAPIAKDGRTLGVLVLRLPADALLRPLADYRGLGQSGDIRLAMAQGDSTVLVAPSRANPGAAFQEQLPPANGQRPPLLEAALGGNGSGVYRAKGAAPLLAAWRYLPSLRLGMAVQLDSAEAFAPVGAFQRQLSLAMLAAVLIAWSLSRWLKRRIAQPLQCFKDDIETVAAGDLSRRASFAAQGEIAGLALAFNRLVGQLQSKQTQLQQALEDQGQQLAQLRAADRELREQQEQLRLIFDSTADGIITIDADGRIIAANATVEQIFGYRLAELLGQNISLLMPEPHRSRHDSYLENYRNGGEPKVLGLTRELQGQRKDGSLCPLDISVRTLRQNGNVAFTAILHDTSARKQSEARLKLLSLAVEQSPSMVYITNNQGVIEYANARLCQILDMRQEELLGQPAEIFRNSASGDNPIWKAVQAGQVWQGQYHGRRKDRSDYWALALVAPIIDSDGRLNHVVAVAEDISDIKRTQKALVHARERADAASRAKSEFLSRMSHELRTPLNAIIGFSQLLADPEEPLEASQRENVQEILTAGQRLLQMVNEVLELSQLESGAIAMVLEPLLLDEVLEESLALVEGLAESHGIGIDASWDSDPNQAVIGNRHRLELCLSNLLSNAVKYNRKGGVLSLRCHIQNGMAHIAVSDQGAGIPPEHLELLFQPFERFGVEYQDADDSLTGIGLAATKRYMELMGGGIEVHSELGVGSTFTLTLPVCEEGGLKP